MTQPPDWISPQPDIWGQHHVISGAETEQVALRMAASIAEPNHDPLDFTKGEYSGPAPAAQPQPKIKKRTRLEPPDGSRLALLFTRLPQLESRKKEAEEELAECKKAIQQEIAATITDPDDMPDQFDIPADPYGGWPAYTLAAREGAWGLDTEAMKTQDPETYVKFARRGRPYWDLRRVQKNRVKR
jgi:hypothetical protein